MLPLAFNATTTVRMLSTKTSPHDFFLRSQSYCSRQSGSILPGDLPFRQWNCLAMSLYSFDNGLRTPGCGVYIQGPWQDEPPSFPPHRRTVTTFKSTSQLVFLCSTTVTNRAQPYQTTSVTMKGGRFSNGAPRSISRSRSSGGPPVFSYGPHSKNKGSSRSEREYIQRTSSQQSGSDDDEDADEEGPEE